MLRTYRRAAGGERKAQVNANRGFLQQFKQFSMRYASASSRASKKHREIGTGSLKIAFRTVSEAFKIHLGAPPRAAMLSKTSQKVPKSDQKVAKMRPRVAQERPTDAQERPRHTKECPEGCQNGQKLKSESLRTNFLQGLGGKPCAKGSRTDFSFFFQLARNWRACGKPNKNLAKTVVFAHAELFRRKWPRAKKKCRKIRC